MTSKLKVVGVEEEEIKAGPEKTNLVTCEAGTGRLWPTLPPSCPPSSWWVALSHFFAISLPCTYIQGMEISTYQAGRAFGVTDSFSSSLLPHQVTVASVSPMIGGT